jgi:hypothetical protein
VPHAIKLCGSFWWRDVMKLSEQFRNVSNVLQGRGDTFLFWSDRWQEVYDQEDMILLFHLPLLSQAFSEFQQLSNIMHSNALSADRDCWIYNLGPFFQTCKFYKQVLRSSSGSRNCAVLCSINSLIGCLLMTY